MGEHFWINPLGLIQPGGSTVDGEEANNRESRPCRSVSRTPSTEAALKQERISTFLKSVEVASDQINFVKQYLLQIQYPHLEPDSLAAHNYEFLNVPEDFLIDSSTCLLDVFQYLQKYGVSLFQMSEEVYGFESNNPEYLQVLDFARDKLVRVLCDLLLCIEMFELVPGEDITYEMLPSHMIASRASARGPRDYLVLRHYSTFLEFLINQKENLMSLAA